MNWKVLSSRRILSKPWMTVRVSDASPLEGAKGVVCGALAAACYGMNPLGAVSLYREGFGTGTVLMFRFGFAAVMLAAYMLISRTAFSLSRRELSVTFLLGALFAVSSMTFYASFRNMDVGIACTILFVYPVMTAALMAVFFREKANLRTWLAMALAFGGIALLSLDGGEHVVTALGVGLVLVSALTYAVYIIVVNRAGLRLSVCVLTFWAVLFCFLCVAGWTALSDGASAFRMPVGLRQWAYALFLAFVPTLLSLVFLTVSVSCVGSTIAAVLGALEPIVAVGVAVVALGEAFTLRLGVGMVVVLAAVILVVVRRPVSVSDTEREVGCK